jgi:hypothetical protein
MIEVVESYVDGNTMYVSTKFLENYYKTSSRNIGNWIKKGLPKYKLKGVPSNVFIFDEVVEWHRENINRTKSNNRKGTEDQEDINMENYEKLSIKEKRELLRLLDKNSLDEKRVVEDIIEKEYKNKQNDKGWVRKEKPSETIRALARTFISTLKNMMISVSKDGSEKSQDELYHIMDKYLHIEIQKLQKLLKGEADIDLHELHRLILDLVSEDIELSEIINKIKEIE